MKFKWLRNIFVQSLEFLGVKEVKIKINIKFYQRLEERWEGTGRSRGRVSIFIKKISGPTQM